MALVTGQMVHMIIRRWELKHEKEITIEECDAELAKGFSLVQARHMRNTLNEMQAVVQAEKDELEAKLVQPLKGTGITHWELRNLTDEILHDTDYIPEAVTALKAARDQFHNILQLPYFPKHAKMADLIIDELEDIDNAQLVRQEADDHELWH